MHVHHAHIKWLESKCMAVCLFIHIIPPAEGESYSAEKKHCFLVALLGHHLLLRIVLLNLIFHFRHFFVSFCMFACLFICTHRIVYTASYPVLSIFTNKLVYSVCCSSWFVILGHVHHPECSLLLYISTVTYLSLWRAHWDDDWRAATVKS